MSEHYPLLYDDIPDDECHTYRRPSVTRLTRQRARNTVKGAAAIIARWQDHWTSLLTYWWIGLAMIALITFVIYSSLLPYAMVHTKPSKLPAVYTNTAKPTNKIQLLPPKVFMHIFSDDSQEINLDKYLPYIQVMIDKYKYFKYELLIFSNDTSTNYKNLGDIENNELAMNMLLTDNTNFKKTTTKRNMIIKYVSLTDYLNDSQLKKHWKQIPKHFIKFLVKAIAIWEKGGIAFDPVILTPQSPHPSYIDIIHKILIKYKPKNKISEEYSKARPHLKFHKMKTKLNNIRDIINALEYEDPPEQRSDIETLDVAESHINRVVVDKRDVSIDYNNTFSLQEIDYPHTHTSSVYIKENSSIKETEITTSKYNLLPMFLEYLFPSKNLNTRDEASTIHKDIEKTQSRENKNKTLEIKDFWDDVKKQNKFKPMIIRAQGTTADTEATSNDKEYKRNSSFEVTIDLNGIIIGTETSCHALVGNILTNVLHHGNNESVTDFIIKELTIFCRGVLSTCVGNDVIFL